MSRPQHVSWRDRSESVEQLDKLLAGLDELSGNLPDLGGVKKQQSTTTKTVTTTTTDSSNNRQHQPVTSYEDDVDYALDRSELGREEDRSNVKVGLQPVVAVDNYSEYYTDWSKARGGDKMSVEETQPYHTRYDSKPFSYIR